MEIKLSKVQITEVMNGKNGNFNYLVSLKKNNLTLEDLNQVSEMVFPGVPFSQLVVFSYEDEGQIIIGFLDVESVPNESDFED